MRVDGNSAFLLPAAAFLFYAALVAAAAATGLFYCAATAGTRAIGAEGIGTGAMGIAGCCYYNYY